LRTSSKIDFERQFEQLRWRIPPACESAYVAFSNPPGRLRTDWQITMDEVAAMWAGLEANVPVVNGYSGNAPPRYLANPGRVASAEELRGFVGADPCVVTGDPAGR
jgi:hypothetical protein